MASTAIPAVKAAILKALEEAEGLEGVTITADKEPERATEYVWIWKAKASRDFKSLGPTPAYLDETVKVTLLVGVIKGSDKSLPSEERAVEILEEVEDALRADPRLGGAALWQRIEDVEGEPTLYDQKRGYVFTAIVTAKARI